VQAFSERPPYLGFVVRMWSRACGTRGLLTPRPQRTRSPDAGRGRDAGREVIPDVRM
jgi:hypothetical protein